jgi:hypothetical protein
MNTTPIDLHPTKKRAVSVLDSSAALVGGFVVKSPRAMSELAEVRDSDSSTTPSSNSEEKKAQLYSIKLKAATASDNMMSLEICLPYIQAAKFPRATAHNSTLLQPVEEIADRKKIPESVLKLCRSLLESWKDSSNCTDDTSGRLQKQGPGDGEAHDSGAAATQDPSPDVGDLLHAVDG